MDENSELKELEDRIINELSTFIHDLAYNSPATGIYEVHPPSTVIILMAKAAAQVAISFERGFRVGEPE